MRRDPLRAVAIKLDPDIRNRVKRLEAASHRTPHWVMKAAMREYVEREEARAILRQDAWRAWEAYQETGQHVTQTEADAWLAQLESDHDVEPPPCHS